MIGDPDPRRRHPRPPRSQRPPHRTLWRELAPHQRKTNQKGLTYIIESDKNLSVSEARDPGGTIPLRWATSFRDPGRHYPVIPGRLRRNRHAHAYATNAHLTLAQISVPEKTNEITAIPVLLDHLAEKEQLEGALVTIDAIGCQVEIAAKIVEHKADFLLPLKGNQPTLEAEVEAYFETAPAEELVSQDHGREGPRPRRDPRFTASKVVDWIERDKSYPGQPRFKDIQYNSSRTQSNRIRRPMHIRHPNLHFVRATRP